VSIDHLRDHWREQRMFLGRIVAAGVITVVLSGLVVYRLVDLQIVHFEHFSRLSQGNRVRLEPVPPVRGLLFDRNGQLLAENQPVYQLELIPEQVRDIEATLAALIELGLVREEDLGRIRTQVRSQRRFEPTILRHRLSEEEAARFAVQRPRFTGVDIQARLARQYPLGASGAHALGYVGALTENDLQRLDTANYAGTAQTGRTGAERAWEDVLHGTTGYRQLLVNAQGRMLQELERTDAVPGKTSTSPSTWNCRKPPRRRSRGGEGPWWRSIPATARCWPS
jgi:penicillin-binding protein 2